MKPNQSKTKNFEKFWQFTKENDSRDAVSFGVNAEGGIFRPAVEVLGPVVDVLQVKGRKRLAQVHLQAGGATGQLLLFQKKLELSVEF